MPLHLVLAHDPTALLEQAAEGFLAPRHGTPADPFPSPPHLLALRQGGLRDDLYRLAARRGVPGWFDPPLCVFGELPARLGPTARRPLGAVERRVLLARILRASGATRLAPRRRRDEHLDALDAHVGELCAADVAPEAFAAALEADPGDERDEIDRQRDGELAALYAAYHDALAADGRRDGRDGLADAARAVAADPDALTARLGGRRELRLVGLQDLRGGWPALLAALAVSPALDRVAIYTSVALDLAALGAVVDDRRGDGSLAARLFAADDRVRGTTVVHGIAAPDPARALEEIARRVRALCDGGVAPHRIAIVAREARPHVDLAVDALARVGVPATARRRVALREVPAVRAVLTLLDAAAAGWTRHALVEVAEQPYLDRELDAHVVDVVGYRRQVRGLAAWRAALAELRDEAAARERGDEPEGDGWERRAALPSVARIEHAQVALAHLAALARPLDRARTLADWLDWLCDVVTEDAWGVARLLHQLPDADRHDVARVDLAGWRALGALATEWHTALADAGDAGATDDERLDAGAFARALRQMLDDDVALWTPSGQGVQVLEGPAAAYRAFDHTFVVGLESGGFPSRAPRSPVLGARERQRLVDAGLPLDAPGAWEAREAELFRALCAGAGTLTLAWAQVDVSGREVVRSIFVDEVEELATLAACAIPLSRVLTPDAPLHATAAAAAHAHRAATIERARRTGALSPWNGEIRDPELRAWLADAFGESRIWSPTQLEHFARCPWAYFAERLLRLETRDEPDDGLEPSVRGRILHRALERFYDFARRERNGAPVLLQADDRDKAERDLLRELDAAIAEFVADGTWLGAPALRDALRAELARILVRYLDFEVEQVRLMHSNRSDKRFILRSGVEAHEVRFDDVALTVGGVVVRFRGSIDRVERGVDERVPDAARYVAAVDYKTSTGAIPGGGDKAAWDDDVVLQLPIYARVLEELYPGDTVSRLEYRSLKGRETKHALRLYQLDKANLLREHEPDNERMLQAMTAIGRHVTNAREGRFPAAPAASCGCPSYCPALDVCRVADGPRRSEHRA